MVAFVVGCLLLLAGYVFYGRLAERALSPDPSRTTPAFSQADGVDFVPMSTWRVYLVQLLNIAGLGPVFGPIMGALWGPQVFFWIVLGCIFGGAVHDFLIGFMSIRNKGAGLPELITVYLGKRARHLATFLTLALLILLGTVFVKGPAMLLVELLPADTVGQWLGGSATAFLHGSFAGQSIWLLLVILAIFTYYILATLLPIDKIIGRFYPIFGAILLFMMAGLGWAIVTGRIGTPAFDLSNLHPRNTPAWPIIFITVSCGAISGFHGTQSPLMSRCLKNERQSRLVFYGAMIVEGLIALVWATVAPGFYGGTGALGDVLAAGGPGKIVHDVCFTTFGTLGGILAVLGVVVLPVTSGDTAFRVARLVIADYLHLPQSRLMNRYKITVPMFAVSVVLTFVDFSIIWRYFGWANQSLATVALWAGAVFLAKRGRSWWMAAVPATFMTAVCVTYILVEDYGFSLSQPLGSILGVTAAVLSLGAFLRLKGKLHTDKTGTDESRSSEREPERAAQL